MDKFCDNEWNGWVCDERLNHTGDHAEHELGSNELIVSWPNDSYIYYGKASEGMNYKI